MEELVCLPMTWNELWTFLSGFVVCIAMLQIIWIIRDWKSDRKKGDK